MKRWLLVALLAAGTTLFAQEADHGEHGAAAEAGHEGGGGELVVPDSLKWANFALLFLGLGYLLGKTLPKSFAERTASIQKEITEAQAIKQDAEKRAALVDAKVAALGKDIEAFKSEAAKDMAHEGDRIRQETVAQIKRIEDQSAAEVEAATKNARRELRQYSAELALKLAEERVRNRMDDATGAALVDGFVADLAKQGSKN